MSRLPDADILDTIAELARRRFGWRGRLEPTTHLVEDLGLDSLKSLELAIEIENHFHIRLDEASEAAIETAGDLVATIRSEVSKTRGRQT
ncbi:MAG: acyl carrier protein [Acidobacteriota bacterium]|nr:acyl carrier protein [Acidobacteriota bacterium]